MTDAARILCAARLAAALDRRGEALLLVSGGSTPLPLYEALSSEALDWKRIVVALVDERWVPLSDPSSNERAVRAALLNNHAAAARFIGLKTDAAAPAQALPEVEERLATAPWPADVAVLGMGPDGHTASWFPNAEGLGAAIDLETDRRAAAVTARRSAVTGDNLDRLTLTASPVLAAGAQLLVMSGRDKKETFARARASGAVEDMPVRTLFLGPLENLYACWAP